MPRLLVTDIARANVDAIAGYIARDIGTAIRQN
jgi:hypothetical protein